MKKRKHSPIPGRKGDTEFSAPVTPDITGGARSASHPDRFPPDRNRADDLPHLGRKGGAT